ncbi:hypothetical protein BST95_08815 [Halioglobus japonicus]|uniref:hypothetical protein n=1 Tax=Halioglobus japonicus TaxID=930805 RepID=UPI0009790FF3|nr:hypothetical protein [Halioglobus japonicus]AQA18316.1 hypothetical protein BST95_08815 [Halioglobus japonicus]
MKEDTVAADSETGTAAQLLWLGELAHQAAGGKAHGLKQLMDWQLPCPNGFVILDATRPAPRSFSRSFTEN